MIYYEKHAIIIEGGVNICILCGNKIFLIPCLVHRIIDIPITQRELLKRSQHIDVVVALQILKIYYDSHVIILFHVDLLN